jgi:lipid-A-disaccharide synthase
MQRAAAGVVASGTATLEAAYFEMPLVIVYKVAWFTWIVGRQLVRVDYLGMPNILAGRRIVPELLQHDATPASIGAVLLDFIRNPAACSEQQRHLKEVNAQLGVPGAAGRAADAICQALR